MKPNKRTAPEGHPFKCWLAKIKQTQLWAVERAAELGETISQGHLSDVMNGKAMPSVSLLSLLERISERRVTVSQMVDWLQSGKAA